MQSPFKFLDSYTREDHDIYFGRTNETEALYTSVFKSKMVLLYGVSGTGKSSLIQCGLANKFQESDWLPVFVRRGTDMLDSLFQSLVQTHIEAPHPPKKRTAKSFLKLLQSLYLDHFKPVYLIFDQFEELFIFGNKEERDEFVQLMEALQQSEVQVKVIFSIREEYLAMLTEFEDRLPELFQNRIRVERMHFPQAKEVIQGACQYAKIEIEEGFEEQLLEKLTGGKKELELTYLQVLLDRLWKKSEEGKNGFTLTLLESMGHISDLLGQFLEEQINELEEPEQGLTVLKTFVSVQGTKKQLTFEEIHHGCLSLGKDVKESGIQDLLQRFTDLRILRDKDESGRYELRHDSLAAKIYEKITLAEKELMEVRQFVEQAFQLYDKKGIILSKDSLDYIAPYRQRMFLKQKIRDFVDASRHYYVRKAKRRRRILFSSITSIMIIAIVSGIFIWRDLQATRETARIATAHNLANQSLDLLQDDDPKQAFKTAVDAYNMEPDFLSKRAVMNAFYQGPFERVKVSLRNVQEYDVTEDGRYFLVFRKEVYHLLLEIYDLSNGKLISKSNLSITGLVSYADRWGGEKWVYDSLSHNVAVLTMDSVLNIVNAKDGLIKQRSYQQRLYSLFDLGSGFCVATGDTIFKYDFRGNQIDIYVPDAFIQQTIRIDKNKYAFVELNKDGRIVFELFDGNLFEVVKRNKPDEFYLPFYGKMIVDVIEISGTTKLRVSFDDNILDYFVVKNSKGAWALLLRNNFLNKPKTSREGMSKSADNDFIRMKYIYGVIFGEYYNSIANNGQNYLVWDIDENSSSLTGINQIFTVIARPTDLPGYYINGKNQLEKIVDLTDCDNYPTSLNDSIVLFRNGDDAKAEMLKVFNARDFRTILKVEGEELLTYNSKYMLFSKNDFSEELFFYDYNGDLAATISSTLFGKDFRVYPAGSDGFMVNSITHNILFYIDSEFNIYRWKKNNGIVRVESISRAFYGIATEESIAIYNVKDFLIQQRSCFTNKYPLSSGWEVVDFNIPYSNFKLFQFWDSTTFQLLNTATMKSKFFAYPDSLRIYTGHSRSCILDSNNIFIQGETSLMIFSRKSGQILLYKKDVRGYFLTDSIRKEIVVIDTNIVFYNSDFQIIDTFDLSSALNRHKFRVFSDKFKNECFIADMEDLLIYHFDLAGKKLNKLVSLREICNISSGSEDRISWSFNLLSDRFMSIAYSDSVLIYDLLNRESIYREKLDMLRINNVLPLQIQNNSISALLIGEDEDGQGKFYKDRIEWISSDMSNKIIKSENYSEPYLSNNFQTIAFKKHEGYNFYSYQGDQLFECFYPYSSKGFLMTLGFNDEGELLALWKPDFLRETNNKPAENPTYLLKLPVTVPRMFEVMQETGLDTTYGFDNIPKNF